MLFTDSFPATLWKDVSVKLTRAERAENRAKTSECQPVTRNPVCGPICHNHILAGRASDAHAALGAEAPSAGEQRECQISDEKMTDVPRFRGVVYVGCVEPQISVREEELDPPRQACK